MSRPSTRLGWMQVRAARMRRAARGRATWLADDLTAKDTDRASLARHPRPAGGSDRSGAVRHLAALGDDVREPAVTEHVPEHQVVDVAEDGPRGPLDRNDGLVDGPEDDVEDLHGDRVDEPEARPGPSPAARARQSLMPERPVREEQPADPAAAGPEAAGGWAARGGRPLMPGWLAHPLAAARRAASHWTHVAAFHGLRLPEYAVRALRWTPRGVARCVVGLYRWATDAEARELRWAAVAREDGREYLHLARQRNQRVHNRGPVAVAALAAVACAVGTGVVLSPGSPLTRVAVLAVTVAVFGAVGAPADRPWIEHATVPPGARKVTPDLLVQAFAAAKLCSLDRDRPPGPIRFLSPVAHDGPGVRAMIDLPAGLTASDALSRREKIAAGLDIDEFRVFLERVRGTAGSARRVVVWVADRDPYEHASPSSPLATASGWDFWRPFPFGLDARGRTVTLPLVWSSLLVGSIPRMGKTNAARIPAAAAALDPHTRLVVFDGKGGKDWKPFEQVAHFYASGVRATVVEALVSVLRDAVEDMDGRYERMAGLPDDICPESKVTPQITRRSGYGMPLTVICVDEVHRYLEHPEHGKIICGLLTELAKAGPAAGYMLVLATQRPDTKTVPDSLRGQIGTRFALRTMNWQASETILGAGSYTAGLDSSKFLRTHLGVGILLGNDDQQVTDGEAVAVRTHLLDLTALRRLCARGRDLRVRAGTLTGTAAGEAVIAETPRRRLLDDVLDMFQAAEQRVWSETLCARLAHEAPEFYDGWDPTTLANALRAFGVDTNQVWGRTAEGTGANRRGVARQDLLDAIAALDKRPSRRPNSAADEPDEHPSGRAALAAGPARSSTADESSDQGPSG
jgi:S-DNA-T family DNA segregation ATPase FtsK/SpoIIIE